jgi:hypothetical protein
MKKKDRELRLLASYLRAAGEKASLVTVTSRALGWPAQRTLNAFRRLRDAGQALELAEGWVHVDHRNGRLTLAQERALPVYRAVLLSRTESAAQLRILAREEKEPLVRTGIEKAIAAIEALPEPDLEDLEAVR